MVKALGKSEDAKLGDGNNPRFDDDVQQWHRKVLLYVMDTGIDRLC